LKTEKSLVISGILRAQPGAYHPDKDVAVRLGPGGITLNLEAPDYNLNEIMLGDYGFNQSWGGAGLFVHRVNGEITIKSARTCETTPGN
jgi:hypothetical protein